jgi:predicted dehydrogenase
MIGVGILGNCCTHGAGLAAALAARSDLQVVTGYEADPRRAAELAAAMGAPLEASYEAVAAREDVQVLVVTSDPCDKADMVELAAGHGKPVLHNKPFADSLDNARRIQHAVEASGICLVHDIPMVRAWPVYARLLHDVGGGSWGRPISYAHSFGMCFEHGFPITDLWPERFDPPQTSGGGEMTNMGCYAIDYLVALFGRPLRVQARRTAFWDAYVSAGVENFGQVLCDYGDFYALLSVGKQQLSQPLQHANWLSLQLPGRNFLYEPYSECLLIDGVKRPLAEYLQDFEPRGSLEELLHCMDTGEAPVSDAATATLGVEVLMAAYRSALQDGAPVDLPLTDGTNPLTRAHQAH